MDYIILVKEEFSDLWAKKDAGDLAAAKREILAAEKTGRGTILAVAVPFEVQLKVGEPGTETKKSARQKYREGVKEPVEEAEVETNPDPAE